MVVLSLAIGLAEQDDFANLPDLQEAPACQENSTPPDKSRYQPGYEQKKERKREREKERKKERVS
ncbi:unnamed protein product [Oncorhynchus mykiss]|uniref:Uncharacterized protein n=1 Tax=Oncorhynchus mykiss TaxID=8022 RepID=A0A061AEP1_ONCMY|nr:unnamed protein product [Oncorhynchus mykiss]